MRAVSESQWCGTAAAWPELVGLMEDTRITVGGCDDDESLLARGDFRAADSLIFGGGAGGCLYRSVEPE